MTDAKELLSVLRGQKAVHRPDIYACEAADLIDQQAARIAELERREGEARQWIAESIDDVLLMAERESKPHRKAGLLEQAERMWAYLSATGPHVVVLGLYW